MSIQVVLTNPGSTVQTDKLSPDLLLSYNPTGYTLTGQTLPLFTIYSKYTDSSSYYVGYQVANYKTDPANPTVNPIRCDCYRIVGANVFQLINGTMVTQSKAVLTNGESEFAFQQTAAADFTGGFHGNEKFTDIKFFINGVLLQSGDLTTSFDLVAIEEFMYIQKSNIFQFSNTGSEVPVCTHHKKTTWKSGAAGYTTFNRVIWTAAIVPVGIHFMYFGLVSMANAMATQVFTENFNYVTLAQGGAEVLNETGAHEVHWFHDTNKLGAYATSTILKPSSLDATVSMVIWDTTPYAKYYRRTQNPATPAAGDIWEGTTTVVHYKK